MPTKGIMKRKDTILMLLAAFLMAAGCSIHGFEPETPAIPDHCIEITIGNIHPSLRTKADHSSGDDAYNENLVESVDCFFYPDGKTDQNAVFIALGRGADPVAEGDSTVYKVKVFFTDADANKMFGNTVAGTCQVYVICNAPLSYGNNTSVADLKELVVEHDFSSQTVQKSFLMHAEEPATVTLTTVGEDRTASGRIHVKRSAAKMQIFLNIPDTFLDEADQLWEPVMNVGVQIMMANAVKRGKVDGNYAVQNSDYVSTTYRMMTELDSTEVIQGMEDYKYSHIPFYSYPSAWTDLSDYAAQFVFRIPWRMQGATDYTYKSYQLSPNLGGLKFEPNHFYRTFVNISSLGGADKEETVIIQEADYVIMEWMNEDANASGQGIVPGELITYKYLVVDEPNITLNNEETAHYTYVTSAPISSIKINTVEYYDNTNAVPLRTQNVNTTVTSDRQTISTNAGSITVSKETPGLVTIYHSLNNMYSSIKVTATITNADNCTQELVFEQNPSIMLVRNTEAGDVFVNGYFARVGTTPPGWGTNDNRYYNSGGYFYHSSSFWNTGNTSAGQTNNSSKTVSGRTTGTYGTIMGSISNLSSSIDRNFYTTIISVTSFNDENDYFVANGQSIHYRIGDPRVPSSTHYNGADSWSQHANFYDYLYYNNNTTELYAPWSDPENILITSQSEEGHSIIAPKFLVSSALNANTGLTFLEAVRRGATYQEAGYPAGRWRLPTEAEIAFIVARQKEGVIPVLYATNDYYWSGSGRLVYIPTAADAEISFSNPSASTSESCRFVYDLWYWGDEPAATNVYHPNGHNTAY